MAVGGRWVLLSCQVVGLAVQWNVYALAVCLDGGAEGVNRFGWCMEKDDVGGAA